VTLLVRSDSLEKGMSYDLAEQLRAQSDEGSMAIAFVRRYLAMSKGDAAPSDAAVPVGTPSANRASGARPRSV
jgi:hypothetical protein